DAAEVHPVRDHGVFHPLEPFDRLGLTANVAFVFDLGLELRGFIAIESAIGLPMLNPEQSFVVDFRPLEYLNSPCRLRDRRRAGLDEDRVDLLDGKDRRGMEPLDL